MSYEVLARKWRPRQFGEVVGQDHVTRTLGNAIRSNRVAHAYLLVGPRGVGKTTIARILAKALNCAHGPTPTPCDECASCREIGAGHSLDVLEIDAASNTGVDHVRELRDNVRYAPARGPYKVYIVDEVHMLSIAAFNALLKTLEEPPGHVKFILATTEPQKVPATIASRCQRFDLRRIATADILAHLEKIAQAEGVKLSGDALLAIARGAEGGLRDAESALDQLIAFRGREIEEEDVLAVFGLAARATLERLVAAAIDGDVAGCIRLVAELEQSGKDLQRVTLELLDQFRNLLVVLCDGPESTALDLAPAQRKALAAAAGRTDAARVQRMVEVLVEAEGRMRFALSKRTLLETALVRVSRAAATVPLDVVLRHLVQFRDSLGEAERSAPPGAPPPRAAAAPYAAPAAPAEAVRETPPAAPDAPAPPPPAAAPAAEAEADTAKLRERWKALCADIARISPRLRPVLPDARVVRVTAAEVELAIPAEYEANLALVEQAQNRRLIQRRLEEELGRTVGLRVSVTAAPAEPPRAGARETAPGAPEGRGTSTDGEVRKRILRDPGVQRALNMFGGTIVDFRE